MTKDEAPTCRTHPTPAPARMTPADAELENAASVGSSSSEVKERRELGETG
jgi:hypothetical protein